MINSFMTSHRFFDSKNYPRGFSRHGDFTIKEAQILEQYGCAFNELYIGIREPLTNEERSFVSVCHGKRQPSTEAERVWIKYISRIKRPKRFHTLSGSSKLTEIIEDYVNN